MRERKDKNIQKRCTKQYGKSVLKKDSKQIN